MAEINAQIALAGKPVTLPEVDFNKTFLTLGQLKYLQAESARTEAQTGLLATQGQAAQADLAETQTLRAGAARRLGTGGDPASGTIQSLRTGAVPAGAPPADPATLAA